MANSWKREDGAMVSHTSYQRSTTDTDTISSRIIDDLQSGFTFNGDAAILYFYIDGSDHHSLAIDMLYSSFVYQLSHQIFGVPLALEDHFRYRQPEQITPGAQWLKLYGQLCHQFRKIYIVIDALDECQEFIELDDMAEMLTKLLDNKLGQTNIFVSSRPLEQLHRSLQDMGALRIFMEDDTAQDDMKMVVHGQLSGSSPFKRWPQKLKNSVENTLLTKCGGS